MKEMSPRRRAGILPRPSPFILFLSILILAAAAGAGAETVPEFSQLQNGLEVILLPIEETDMTALSIAFRGGADAQTAKTAGMFNLLEKVIFRGSASSPGEAEPAGAFEALDAAALAGGAGLDRFSFSFSVDSGLTGQAIDTVAYLFSGLRLESALSDPKALKEAKLAAARSIDETYSSPDAIYSAALLRKMFSSAPWRLDATGADYNIEGATDASLRSLASAWLVPNNAVLILAGGFDPAEALSRIGEAFSSWKKAPDPWKSGPSPLPKPGVARPTMMVYPDPSMAEGKASIEMRYRGPDSASPRLPAAILWGEMVSNPAGRLAQAVVRGMPKWSAPSDLKASCRVSRDSSWISVSATVSLDRKGSLAEAAMNFKETVRGTEMYAVKTNPSYFSAKEYAEAREAFAGERRTAFADPSPAAAFLGNEWIMGGKSQIQEMAGRLEKVTVKDIGAFADEFFMKNLEIVAVRVNPADYANQKKGLDAYGFELITPQKAFWWR